jgi:membrane-bound lytic murein transglycosylase MltF
LIWQESRFNPRAVSPAGAQGLAQFMPRIAAHYGLEDPFDPLAALPASARMLRELYDQFGNLGLAAAAYNGGSGRIQNWLARRGKLPEETRNYVRIITGQAAENWIVEDKQVDLALSLPPRAPCEGVAGLSRKNEIATVSVNLTDNIARIIQTAEAAAAKAAVAAREAAKEAARKLAETAKAAKQIAKNVGRGKNTKLASRNGVSEKTAKADKKAGKDRVRLADVSARRK